MVRRHRRRLELEAARQVPADGPPRRPGDGYESLLVSFTQHFGLLSLKIEVREIETVKFRQPETTPVQELEDDQVPRPSKGILRRARFRPREDPLDVCGSRVSGKTLLQPGRPQRPHRIHRHPVFEMEETVERTYGRQLPGDGPAGQALLATPSHEPAEIDPLYGSPSPFPAPVVVVEEDPKIPEILPI